MFGHYYFGDNFFSSQWFGPLEGTGVRPSGLSMSVSVGHVTFGGVVDVHQIGSIENYTSGGNANTGTISVTVPTGTTLIVVGVSGYQGTTGGFQSMTFTKGGIDTAMTRVPGGDIGTLTWQGAMFYITSPDVGASKSLKWDWIGSGNSADGELNISWTFWGGTATVDVVRDSGYSQGAGFPRTTGTIRSYPYGDRIIAFCSHSGPGDGSGAIDSWQNVTELGEIPHSSAAEGTWAADTQTGDVAVAALTATASTQGALMAASFRPPGTIWAAVTGNTMAASVGTATNANTYGVPAPVTSNAMACSVGQVTLAGNIWVDVVQTGAIGQAHTSGNANTGTVSGITVPADAELIIVGVSGVFSVVPHPYEAMTFTKGGVDTAMTKAAVGGDADNTKWEGALFYLVNPDTGSGKSLKWDWIGTDPSSVAAAQNITWTFWKGIETGRPVRYSTGLQTNTPGMVIETGLLDIRPNANDTVVAFASFAGPGDVTEWSGVEDIGFGPVTSYADNAWAAAVPAQTPRTVGVVEGTGTGIALMVVVLRSISAAGEVFLPSSTTALTASVGTVTVTGVDNRQANGWDASTTSPLTGALTGGDTVLLSVAGAGPYTARSTVSHGSTRTSGEDNYAEVTIGGAPTGYVGLYNAAENTGAMIELATGDLVEFPSGDHTAMFDPIVDGDVIGIAFKAAVGKLWFRVNGGLWNGDADATPEGEDWPDETSTGCFGPLTIVPDELSEGVGWRWRFDDLIIMVTDANVVLENLHIKGMVATRSGATGLIVRNCKLEPLGSTFGAEINCPDATIEYCTVAGLGGALGTGEPADGNGHKGLVVSSGAPRAIFRYNNIYGFEDGIFLGSEDCIIEYNYVHDHTTGQRYEADDPHSDGIQLFSGQCDRTIIQHNYFNGVNANNDVNSSMIMGVTDGFVLNHNKMIGGGYTIFICWRTGNTVTNNHIGRAVGSAGTLTVNGVFGPGTPIFSGNVDFSGNPIFPPFGFTPPPDTANATGSSAPASVGTVTVTAKRAASVNVTGNSVAASVGNETVRVPGIANATGNSVAASAGTVTVSVGASSWPDATNTGTSGALTAVPGTATSGTGWTWHGTPDFYVEVTSSSVTISNLDADGPIVVPTGRTGVTISNCRVECTDTYGIFFDAGAGVGGLVEDCEVVGPGGSSGAGMSGIRCDGGSGFTVQRCDISGVENGIFIGATNCLIEDNYIHDLAPENANDVITNGSFSADANWTKSGTTISGGKGVFSSAATNSSLTQSVSVTAATDYTVVFTVSNYSGGTVTPQLTGGSTVSGTGRTANGTYSDNITAASGNNAFRLLCTGTTTLNVDDVTVFAEGPHTDGIQLVGGNECDGTTIQHNAVHSVHSFATSALIMSTSDHVTVTNNKLRGGYSVLYVYKDSTNVYTNNRIGDQSEVTGSALVSDTGGAGTPTWTGNVNDDTEATIPAP